MRLSYTHILLIPIIWVVLISCRADGNDPGIEYAPQMYHSVPYEPLSQITEEDIPEGPIASRYYITNSLPYNDYEGKVAINSLKPIEGTVARQNFTSVTNTSEPQKNQPLYFYDLHKDSIALAGRVLKNPLPETDDILKEGKHLYIGFCAPCHGAQGNGQGKVGVVYQGVANFQARAYSNIPEGHIFHVITHGKGRMWAHKSQLSPEDRWKVVRYVQKLQKGEN